MPAAAAAAATTSPHNNTLGGIQLENYTSSVLLAVVILHAHIYARAHTHAHKYTEPFGIKQQLWKCNKKVHSVRNLQMESLRVPVKLRRDHTGLQDM